MYFLWAWPAYFAVFQLEKPTVKGRLDVCGESPHPLFGLEKKPTFKPKLASAVAYCRVYWAFISCVKAVFTTQEVAHMGQDKQR